MAKSKKLHVQVLKKNWDAIQKEIKDTNNDSYRVFPEIKHQHVVNMALDKYLSRRMDDDGNIIPDKVFKRDSL